MFYQCGLILEGSPPFDITAQDSHQPISKDLFKQMKCNIAHAIANRQVYL